MHVLAEDTIMPRSDFAVHYGTSHVIKYCIASVYTSCSSATFVMLGPYSAVPPPASIQKAPAAPAASKAKESDSSDSSDDSSDEDEKKKVAG